MPSAPPFAAVEEYDRQYQVWAERQGPRALDLDWRFTHLLWRHRALLRRRPDVRPEQRGCLVELFPHHLGVVGIGAPATPRLDHPKA